ncbi:MAG TPA: hypothetical protein DD734_11960, partial [Firmicutes bacterium]|nr:hypothetical protein [Bacillota bacterium]
ERIYVGKPNDFNQDQFWEDLVTLAKRVSVADRVKVVEKLYQIIPKYTPSQRWLDQMVAAGKEEPLEDRAVILQSRTI